MTLHTKMPIMLDHLLMVSHAQLVSSTTVFGILISVLPYNHCSTIINIFLVPLGTRSPVQICEASDRYRDFSGLCPRVFPLHVTRDCWLWFTPRT